MPSIIDDKHDAECGDWFAIQIGTLTEKSSHITPSEWAEANRYLPPSVTPLPGYYSYLTTPFLREIADCIDRNCRVREIAIMKGAQIGGTVGILENAIGYLIAEVKSAPAMLLTADADLAKLRMESYITPMIEQSGLAQFICTADTNNARKTGKTNDKVEWMGGGFLVPVGAGQTGKLRSLSIQCLFQDEVDAFPAEAGSEGDPSRLAENRTKAFHQTRKIVKISTPLIKGSSRIDKAYKDGDQRKYFVPCKKCGEMQILKFHGVDEETGAVWGLVYQTDNGKLLPDTVRYACRYCGHLHHNSDKSVLLPKGEWRATAIPKTEEYRSYHISALYSPPEMFTWSGCVQAYLDGWDEEHSRIRDIQLYQDFYNNVLGEPFEMRGNRIRFETVSAHRRQDYKFGEINNTFAKKYCGSDILLLTCTVDVHKSNLAVGIFGWTKLGRVILVDYWRFEGETTNIDDADTWGRLDELITTKRYVSDNDKSYPIYITMIDAQFQNDVVNAFCKQYDGWVFPVHGRARPKKKDTGAVKEFSETKTKTGLLAFNISVDMYKDRWSASLRKSWDGVKEQPIWYFNAPSDATDKQLKELTVEFLRLLRDKEKKVIGYEWHRQGGADNELWDLLVYATAAFEVVAYMHCKHYEIDTLNWSEFYQYAMNNPDNAFWQEHNV